MKLSAPIYHLKRQARLLARDRKIALHLALDHVAREEGFASWSLLAANSVAPEAPAELLAKLSEGDMLLLAARPGQGKTMLGLRLLLEALHRGRRAVFFTLEYSLVESRARFGRLVGATAADREALEIVESDDICADYIIRYLTGAPRGTVAVIDYLQILDQRRNKPEIAEQAKALREFAGQTGIILVFISQVDRSYDAGSKPLPDMRDIRLPNQLDLTLFSKACFLHENRMRFHGEL